MVDQPFCNLILTAYRIQRNRIVRSASKLDRSCMYNFSQVCFVFSSFFMLLSFLFDYTVYNRILYNFLTINIFACVFFSFLWYDREINTYIFYQEDILMIALKLTNVKACMSHLLLMDTFDSFLLIEGEIMTFNTFKIDGFIQKKLLYF